MCVNVCAQCQFNQVSGFRHFGVSLYESCQLKEFTIELIELIIDHNKSSTLKLKVRKISRFRTKFANILFVKLK